MQERKDKYSLELCCVLRKKHQSPSSECTPPGELGVWMNGNISLYLAADAYSEGSSVSSLQAPFVISGKKSFFNLQFIWTTLAIYFRIRWIMLWKHLCLHLLQEKTGCVGQVQYRNENRQTLLKSILSILKMGTLETWDCPLSVLSNIQQGTWKHHLYQRPNAYIINIFSYVLQSIIIALSLWRGQCVRNSEMPELQ